MVEQRCKMVLDQILELLDTACQASLELLEQLSKGNTDGIALILTDLQAVMRAVNTAQKPLLPQLEHAYTPELLENVEDTLDEIQRSLDAGDFERAAVKMEFQLFPFLRQLREAFYFWGTIYPDQERMDHYYKEEFAEHFQNYYVQENGPAQFQLSIVIAAFNHLETTKRCVSQLLKETDFEKLQAELILIDHGSTDGTLEYFESLGVGKVIHFKHNVRMYVFCILSQLCQGKYFSFVSNDILVTKDWAENLLKCLESDPKIIAAVPATPNISNYQSRGLPDLGPEDFVAWANGQNRHDPSSWNDRARLMPPLGMFRTSAVSALGFADPCFYSMEFWDDDFSLRARRAGYRQLVCNDVACYHFGSVTGKEAQVKENTLVYGRELFKKKHGVDAWGVGGYYDYQAMPILLKAIPPQGSVDFLGLDCGMGDTPLQVKNELRHRGQDCKIYQLTSMEAYLADIKPHSAQAYFVPELAAGLRENFDGITFRCAYMERDIGQYRNFSALLEAVSQRLAPNGWFVFSCSNPFFVMTFDSLLQFALPGDSGQCVLTDPQWVRREAERYFSQVQLFGLEQTVDGLDAFAARYFGNIKQLPQIAKRLSVQKYYFMCVK